MPRRLAHVILLFCHALSDSNIYLLTTFSRLSCLFYAVDFSSGYVCFQELLMIFIGFAVLRFSLKCMSQGRKKHMARRGLEPRTSRIPCEHHWATEPHGRSVAIFYCLIRFVLESAQKHAETDETFPLLLAITGKKKAHGPMGTRTQGLSHTIHSDHWATEPHGRPVTVLEHVDFKILNLKRVVIIFEPRHDKTTKVSVRPAKTQISLGIRPVWSESSLCAQWVAKDTSFLHADSEDSSDWADPPRLIWVFAGRTLILLALSCRGSFYFLQTSAVLDCLLFTQNILAQRNHYVRFVLSQNKVRIYIKACKNRTFWRVFTLYRYNKRFHITVKLCQNIMCQQ